MKNELAVKILDTLDAEIRQNILGQWLDTKPSMHLIAGKEFPGSPAQELEVLSLWQEKNPGCGSLEHVELLKLEIERRCPWVKS